MSKNVVLTLAFSFFIALSKAYAYPNFIGHGYTACLTCHYNPFGNGPLTDYGRAVGATGIADRVFHSSSTSEEEVANASGFLWSKPKSKMFRPSINYRGLYLQNNYGEDNSENQVIHMVANANLVVKAGKKDEWIASATIGYAPTPLAEPENTEENYRSREHYIGHRPNETWGFYVGLMDKVFGIRVPDHIAYNRAPTFVAQNDQAHGVVVHYTKPKWDIGLQYFIGNIKQEDNIRQVGLTGQVEYSLFDRARVGASYLSSASEFVALSAYSLHTRVGFGKGNSIMAEWGAMTKTPEFGTLPDVTTSYLFIQNHVLLSRGLFLLATIESLTPNSELETSITRWGPGIQYFINHGVELRLDIYNARTFSDRSVSDDVWDLGLQLHIWI